MADAITYSNDVVTEEQFWTGLGNLQLVHQMQNGAMSSGAGAFTLAFTDSNSFLLGLTQAATNVDLVYDAGKFNQIKGGIDTQGYEQNPLRNVTSQDAGIDAFDSYNFGTTISFLKSNVDNRILDFAHCFAKGTEINCPEGLKKIEDVQPGDLVFSFSNGRRIG